MAEGDLLSEVEMKAYKTNFGIWLTLGMLHPGNTGYRFTYLIFVLAYVLNTPLMVVTAVLTLRTEPGTFCEEVHFIVFISILLSTITSFNLQKDKVAHLFRHFGSGFHDYKGTLDPKTIEEIKEMTEESGKRKELFTKVVLRFFGVACVVLSFLNPVLKVVYKEHLVNAELDDGMHRLLMLTYYFPADKFSLWSNLMLFGVQLLLSVCCLGCVSGHIGFIMTSCEDIVLSSRICGLTMRRIGRRADFLTANMSRGPALRMSIAESIKHHQEIILAVKKLESIYYIPALSFVGGSTVLMCMSGFLFVNKDVSIIAKVVFAFFLSGELIGTFVYCYYGEQVKTYSEKIAEDIYESDWLRDMGVLKNHLLLVIAKSREGFGISCGGFMYLSLETYSNILSTSFSYFNLMNAVS